MTADHSGDREVDIDLLADYAGGALDGTPDRERVRHLIGTDPAWAAALEDLQTADALVGADLASLASDQVTMPADVSARLDRALAGVRGEALVDDLPEDAGVPEEQPAGLIPLASKRRRYRRAAVAAVAAGVVGIAGYFWYAVTGPGGLTHSETTAGNSGEDARSAQAAPTPGTPTGREQDSAPADGPAAKGPTGYPVPVSVSGRNYTHETLSPIPTGRGETATGLVRPPHGLERLAAPTALQGCLRAIGATYPGRIDSVDFARFEGQPALIVIIQQSGDEERVVVAGPNCRPSDADEKYAVTD